VVEDCAADEACGACEEDAEGRGSCCGRHLVIVRAGVRSWKKNHQQDGLVLDAFRRLDSEIAGMSA